MSEKIKVADYISKFLEKKGIKDIFLVSGGGIIHLLDSLSRRKKIRYYCCLHEQGVAMATEAYARVKDDIGVSMVTTGPGGTNAITGVAGSWIDSVPHLTISGQAFVKQTIGDSGLRQLGVQEINIIDLVKPITKYAVMITDPLKIRYHLEKAIYLASAGRPGPVWLDIPADIQMAMIDEKDLKTFDPKKIKIELDSEKDIKEKVKSTVELLKKSKRPIIYVGQGVKISKAVPELIKFIEEKNIPLLTARNANDIIESEHELFIGRPGTFGQRAANFAVQNSDLMIIIGTRLSLPQIGYDYKDYGRNAKKVIVDIDRTELEKVTVSPEIAILSDARVFIDELKEQLKGIKLEKEDWLKRCQEWKKNYPVVVDEYKNQKKHVNSYYFVDILSDLLDKNDITVTDMGFSFQCTHQAFKVKKGQKFFTSSGLASMGYGLPAAIGACIANDKKRVICISGDGGLQMNIQELQTIINYKLPIKLFIFNNQGYLTIKQTQELNFGGTLVASEPSSGVIMPDMIRLGEAYGFKSVRITEQKNLKEKIKEVLDYDGPIICDIVMDENQIQAPMSRPLRNPDGTLEKKPIEDMFPYLDKEEFRKNMLFND